MDSFYYDMIVSASKNASKKEKKVEQIKSCMDSNKSSRSKEMSVDPLAVKQFLEKTKQKEEEFQRQMKEKAKAKALKEAQKNQQRLLQAKSTVSTSSSLPASKPSSALKRPLEASSQNRGTAGPQEKKLKNSHKRNSNSKSKPAISASSSSYTFEQMLSLAQRNLDTKICERTGQPPPPSIPQLPSSIPSSSHPPRSSSFNESSKTSSSRVIAQPSKTTSRHTAGKSSTTVAVDSKNGVKKYLKPNSCSSSNVSISNPVKSRVSKPTNQGIAAQCGIPSTSVAQPAGKAPTKFSVPLSKPPTSSSTVGSATNGKSSEKGKSKSLHPPHLQVAPVERRQAPGNVNRPKAMPAVASVKPMGGIAAQLASPSPFNRSGIAAQFGNVSRKQFREDSDEDDYYSDEEDDYEDEFIDDSEDPGPSYGNVIKEIHRSLRFDPTKYCHINPWDDCRSMEAKFSDIEKEEKRSARLAKKEDLEDIRNEMLMKMKKKK